MDLLRIVLALSWLLPIPAAAPDVGTVTYLEGSLRIIRGTAVLQAVEGTRLRHSDIVETSDKGFAQAEFVGGGVVALGPSTRLYVLWQGPVGKSAKGTSATELVLLSGWLKGQSDSHVGSYRYQSPTLAATTGNGTVVIHSVENGCDIFVESGSAAIAEVSPNGSVGKPTAATAGQYYSRRLGKGLSGASHPNAAFVDAMPRAFRDALPSLLAHFTSKPVEPRVQHLVSYAEIQAWLTMPSEWRRGFVERFEPRLKDPAFRKELEIHAAEYPEWAPILHPEKQ
ncbi:MAG: hypothetical protein ACRD5M_07600 [Candidatus Acidiferrales bacterium]